MTEKKKRFFQSKYWVIDREKGRNLQMYEIIDLLNEQDNEINELKKENKKQAKIEKQNEYIKSLEKSIDYMVNKSAEISIRNVKLWEKNGEMQNENRRLKKEAESLQKKIDILCEVFEYGSDESIMKMKKLKQK